MKIHLRFFATYRERFRMPGKDLELEAPRQAREVFFSLFESRHFAERLLAFTRFAVNGEYVAAETMLCEGDELAFIPPVSGG